VLYGYPVDITHDAVTRATTWNEHSGEVVALTDGKHPENSADPDAFVWQNKGILVFEFPAPAVIAQVRVYVGDEAGGYILRAYLGGRTNEDGAGRNPYGEREATVENAEYITNGWTALNLPTDTVADNLELVTIGAAAFFEVQILSEDGRLLGDVTDDGEITSYDASWILQHTVGLQTLAGADSVAADVSGEYGVTSYDASLVLQYVVGRIAQFPVEEDPFAKAAYAPRTMWK